MVRNTSSLDIVVGIALAAVTAFGAAPASAEDKNPKEEARAKYENEMRRTERYTGRMLLDSVRQGDVTYDKDAPVVVAAPGEEIPLTVEATVYHAHGRNAAFPVVLAAGDQVVRMTPKKGQESKDPSEGITYEGTISFTAPQEGSGFIWAVGGPQASTSAGKGMDYLLSLTSSNAKDADGKPVAPQYGDGRDVKNWDITHAAALKQNGRVFVAEQVDATGAVDTTAVVGQAIRYVVTK